MQSEDLETLEALWRTDNFEPYLAVGTKDWGELKILSKWLNL